MERAPVMYDAEKLKLACKEARKEKADWIMLGGLAVSRKHLQKLLNQFKWAELHDLQVEFVKHRLHAGSPTGQANKALAIRWERGHALLYCYKSAAEGASAFFERASTAAKHATMFFPDEGSLDDGVPNSPLGEVFGWEM